MGARVTLTPELRDAFQAFRAEGVPSYAIAEKLGVSRNTLDRFARELGIPPRPPSLWRDPNQIERLRTLRRTGHDYYQIAYKLGTTARAVSSQLTRMKRQETTL